MPRGSSKEADEHAAHHPVSSPAAAAPDGYDQKMKLMQEMHQKMALAKTPEERTALMNDHMKAMHEGMRMMGQMGGKGMEGAKGEMRMDPAMIERRMETMEMMMRMMVDRECPRTPGTE